MLKKIILIIFVISSFVFAENPIVNVTEEDGSPSTYPYKIKFANGSLTDNGDSTVSVASGGGESGAISLTVDGAGSALSAGIVGWLQIKNACTIYSATMLADQSGSAVVDIWVDSYANYPPTVADTITASAKPTLSSAIKSTDSTLTGWTKTVSAGDVMYFNLDSASTITKLVLVLEKE